MELIYKNQELVIGMEWKVNTMSNDMLVDVFQALSLELGSGATKGIEVMNLFENFQRVEGEIRKRLGSWDDSLHETEQEIHGDNLREVVGAGEETREQQTAQ